MSISNQKQPYHFGDLRLALMEAALVALETQPADKVSLRKLAKDIGVSHNAPYMHFKTKDALWQAVSDMGFQKLEDHLRQAIELESHWSKRLVACCQAYVSFSLNNSTYMQVMFRPRSPDEPDGPTASANRAFEILVGEISRSQELGQIKEGASEAYAVLIWSIVHGFSEISQQTRRKQIPINELTIEESASWLILQTLEGIANK